MSAQRVNLKCANKRPPACPSFRRWQRQKGSSRVKDSSTLDLPAASATATAFSTFHRLLVRSALIHPSPTTGSHLALSKTSLRRSAHSTQPQRFSFHPIQPKTTVAWWHAARCCCGFFDGARFSRPQDLALPQATRPLTEPDRSSGTQFSLDHPHLQTSKHNTFSINSPSRHHSKHYERVHRAHHDSIPASIASNNVDLITVVDLNVALQLSGQLPRSPRFAARLVRVR